MTNQPTADNNSVLATTSPPHDQGGRAADPSAGLPAVPVGWTMPARRAAARAVLKHAVHRVPIRVRFPDGTEIGAGTSSDPVMVLHRPDDFFARLGADAKIGFGEAYMAGDWAPAADTDLAELLTPFAEHLTELVPRPLQYLRRWVDRQQPATEENTPDQARENIHRHYDLSNDLFATFLDETMTYSSAWFEPGDSLADAQRRKIDGILDYAGVGHGSAVLEIGTGWGELAIRAAQRGAHVTSLTLSREQLDLAQRRVAEAGVAGSVEFRLADYRDVEGQYDAVVSIEMIEAVGQQYWPLFFRTIERVLRPGGLVGLQAITMPHRQMVASSRSYTWIHKYIFPGGIVPSVQAIEEVLASSTALEITDRRTLGPHYATTLRQWRQRFIAACDRVADLGFDEEFQRMWEFYLAYSEAGFRARYLDAFQFRLRRR